MFSSFFINIGLKALMDHFISEKNTAVVEPEQQAEKLFDPPLYKQRYAAVADVINRYQSKNVVDIGCAEGQFLNYVKEFCSSVEEIVGVDINEQLLKSNVFRLKPLTYEYLIKRKRPLRMAFYCGSIAKADSRFCGVDMVSCIECIEHLHEDTLQGVPLSIFGKLEPKVVVITTPNSEYNVLFKNFSGMRHTDHKFEWTRHQFQTWCEAIIQRYNYQVTFTGVGDPKDGFDVGFCSQIAIFTREEVTHKATPVGKTCSNPDEELAGSYELVFEFDYPFENPNENRSEKILHEVEYVIYHQYLPTISEELLEDTILVPIDKLLTYSCLQKFNVDKLEIISLLDHLFYQRGGKLSLSDDKQHILVSHFFESDDESGVDNDTDSEPIVNDDFGNFVIEEENWD